MGSCARTESTRCGSKGRSRWGWSYGLWKRSNSNSCNFEIRFHFIPGVKITKTQDENSILIELENSGWKFLCKDHKIDVETGLYFGKKNSFVENQNIFISGLTQNEDQEINWELIKI